MRQIVAYHSCNKHLGVPLHSRHKLNTPKNIANGQHALKFPPSLSPLYFQYKNSSSRLIKKGDRFQNARSHHA